MDAVNSILLYDLPLVKRRVKCTTLFKEDTIYFK